MKKYILSALAVITAFAFSAQAASISLQVNGNTATNLLSVIGTAKITQIILTPASTNQVTVALFDNNTNALTYVIPAYTNTVSYQTNATLYSYTDYFGKSVLITNFYQVDLTNNLVASTTNAVPIRAVLTATGGNTVRADGVNYYFNTGVWATNQTANNGTVTITYQQ